MRAALYLRVSTKPRPGSAVREQTVENQRLKLTDFAKAMDWTVVAEYANEESGASATRPQFSAMIDAASRREFDCVLVWSLDRFSREGIGETYAYLSKLASYKVAFRSFTESFLDTTGDFGDLMVALFAFFASFERKRIIERTKAGLDRARVKGTKSGKAIGRPKLVVDRSKAMRLRDKGKTVRQIAEALEDQSTSQHKLIC